MNQANQITVAVFGAMTSLDITSATENGGMRWRAAQYVRMSTEHQQYSTENQRDKIREYAAKRGIGIVQTYADEGKSGLRLDGRQALQQLIRDVESGQADFQMIRVYDVSRWGRFQDASVRHFVQFPHVPIHCDISKFNFGHFQTLASESRETFEHQLHPKSRPQTGDLDASGLMQRAGIFWVDSTMHSIEEIATILQRTQIRATQSCL